jgi:histidyl-tRNA synthetase
MDKAQRVRGTQDIFGEEAARFDHVVRVFDRVRRLYGFKPVQVPMFEYTNVFARSIGETTDVVSKEMYSFEDRGGESITLRPEFTAGIARAYIANGWQQHAPLKLAAWGAAFRYERPQKGRYRQFHQLDAEILGAAEPASDVELLAFAAQLLSELGLGDKVVLQLNTVGDAETRAGWRDALVAYFTSVRGDLSPESQERLEKNPLRILDSKDDRDRRFVADAPRIDSFLTIEAGRFFETVCRGLDACGVAYERTETLVRGLDYYRHTAFEFVTTHLGAQGTVIGGGRYDGLIEALGGPHTPAVGWAGGIERLAMLCGESEPETVDVAVVPLGEAAETAALGLLQRLRAAGLGAEQAWRGNMKKRMARADASGARVALILGDDELAAGMVALKDLKTGEQSKVPLREVVEFLTHPDVIPAKAGIH